MAGTRAAAEVYGPGSKKKEKLARVPGGRAPTSKKIVPNYDSEDEIIITMKQKGYSDQDVVDRLVAEGRTRYDPKSAASRWQRLRACIQNNEEELLEEGLTDWHEGEVRL